MKNIKTQLTLIFKIGFLIKFFIFSNSKKTFSFCGYYEQYLNYNTRILLRSHHVASMITFLENRNQHEFF